MKSIVTFEVETSDTGAHPEWRNFNRWIDSCIRLTEKAESGVKLVGYTTDEAK